jgi:hypothetical protein
VHSLDILASKDRVVVDDMLGGTDVRVGVGIELRGLVGEVEVDRVGPGEGDCSVLVADRVSGQRSLNSQKMRGMHMACLVPILSATFPRMTGMMAPPQTEETRKEAPRLV